MDKNFKNLLKNYSTLSMHHISGIRQLIIAILHHTVGYTHLQPQNGHKIEEANKYTHIYRRTQKL